MSLVQKRIIAQLSLELGAKSIQIQAAVDLLDDGATVPFIARYRKEATGGLDDVVLRSLQERLVYLRELEDRRASILESIQKQGKLDSTLQLAIEAANNKQLLEDLYLPYKPKRRTRAQIAREAGLQDLADKILADRQCVPAHEALAFVNLERGVPDPQAALEGARDILSEQFAENAKLLDALRTRLQEQGALRSRLVEEKRNEAEKFQDYFEHQEKIAQIATHRTLAMLRGREQGFLTLKVDLPEYWALENSRATHPLEGVIANLNGAHCNDSEHGRFMAEVCRWTWRIKLYNSLENEILALLKEKAQADAIQVFGKNLKDLLLAAPAGAKPTMGLDPGIRTGVKVAIVNATSQVTDFTTIYPHEPRKQWQESIDTLAALCIKHQIELIAIGNGTASRETDQLVTELFAKHTQLTARKVVVSEAGASVYSASALATSELPDLDVSIRGAVSIARRLQDPLAELVKIDPKAIGVGQYQHDVDQKQLSDRLSAVVEDCVNAVGVEVNTASEALLARVSGLNSQIAKSLVAYRSGNGRFANRAELKKVPRLGEKTFEQAAGFLRIQDADNPLDRSAVHPESYSVVEQMAKAARQPVSQLLANSELLKQLKPEDFVTSQFGLPTIRDILGELEKPGRDPRPAFKTARFDDSVPTLKDLKSGMTLEGVVTNVANFGAFVDIGVHQDGLVHISALANSFVKDPHSVVKAGDIVKVKVLEVDLARKRIALSMRLDDKALPATSSPARPSSRPPAKPPKHDSGAPSNNALAAAFAKAKINGQ